MRYLRLLLLCLFVASLGGGLGASDSHEGGGLHPFHTSSKKRLRADPTGSYALDVAGCCRGSGTATVSATSVSLTANVSNSHGSGTLFASNLAITGDYFSGAGAVMGVDCTIYGRVDIPTAQDDEQTDVQASTGRITGTFRDANGHVGRILAIQLH